jgi:uncharacterized protein
MSRVLKLGPEDSEVIVIMAHGAGAGNNSEFMTYHAKSMADQGYLVLSFNFDYMQTMIETGKRRPPERQAKLESTYIAHITEAVRDYPNCKKIVLVGKSMGGKIASFISTQQSLQKNVLNISAVIALGYPFYPVNKKEKLPERTNHFVDICIPFLVIQGERDALGSRDFIESITLANVPKLKWLIDGDHSFTPRKSSGLTEQDNWQQSIKIMCDFIESLPQ